MTINIGFGGTSGSTASVSSEQQTATVTVRQALKGDKGDAGDVGGTIAWDNVTGKPTEFAPLSHTHSISNVTGLQSALDAKLDDSQASVFGLSLIDDADAATAHSTLGLGSAAQSSSSDFAAASHGHAIAGITGLQAALDAKLDDSQASVFGLSLLDDADAAAARTTLGLGTAATQASSAFAAASHSHAISDVTGLQTALDGKQASLVSGTNIRSVNGTSLLGSGNLTITENATHTGDVTGSGALTIANNVVSNAKLATVSPAIIKGRVTSGTGNVEDLTGTQATTLLDVFTSGLKGLAPASGGGTTNFLRADGSWAAPSGGGGGMSWTTIHNATPTAVAQIVVDLTGYSIIRWSVSAVRHNSGSNQSIHPFASTDGGSTYGHALCGGGFASSTADVTGGGLIFRNGRFIVGIGYTANAAAGVNGTTNPQHATPVTPVSTIAFKPTGGSFQAVGNITVEGLI